MRNLKKWRSTKVKKIIRKAIPGNIRKTICNTLIEISFQDQLTISQDWERYAQEYNVTIGQNLGDEWNESKQIGIDVPNKKIPTYLNEKLFKPFLGKSDVLCEIGSGGGRFTEVLLQDTNKLIATDTSRTMLSKLKNRFNTVHKIEYILLSGQDLMPLNNNSVDAVFSYGVFVHLLHWDIFNYLCELYRVLKPNGRAIIQHANTFSELGWNNFTREIPHSLNKHKLSWSFTLMTPQIIEEFVTRAGLTMHKCITDLVKRDCITLIIKS